MIDIFAIDIFTIDIFGRSTPPWWQQVHHKHWMTLPCVHPRKQLLDDVRSGSNSPLLYLNAPTWFCFGENPKQMSLVTRWCGASGLSGSGLIRSTTRSLSTPWILPNRALDLMKGAFTNPLATAARPESTCSFGWQAESWGGKRQW